MTNLLNYLTQARLVKAKFETGCCHVRLGSLQASAFAVGASLSIFFKAQFGIMLQ